MQDKVLFEGQTKLYRLGILPYLDDGRNALEDKEIYNEGKEQLLLQRLVGS